MLKNNKSAPYSLGFLGLIPLVGFFVGIALILNAIFKYKDRKLFFIGLFGVVFSLIIYGYLFYDMKYGKESGSQFAKMAQNDLNSLVNQIELHKLSKGVYPDSLSELREIDPYILISDPLLLRKMRNNSDNNFFYKNHGVRYELFSVGFDGLPHTEDDIFPNLKGNIKYGWEK